MGIINQIRAKAKVDKKTIVLPESEDERVLRAAVDVTAEGIAEVVLIGDPEKLHKMANELCTSLEGIKIINPETFQNLDKYIDKLVEKRAKKGMTPEEARKILTTDVNFFGAMMVAMKDVDGMVSGSLAPTANILRAGFQVVGPKPGVKTISSVFMMELKSKTEEFGDIVLFGDCAVIPEPTSEQLADIAKSAAQTARSVAGMEPRVGLLSFSTKGSAKHPSVDTVIKAGEILKESNVDFKFEAELQADAALVEKVGKYKAPGSEVAGTANVLIFPNLAAGNIGYKLVQRLAGAEAYGPLLQGLASPINDLSRGCSTLDIVNLVAITAVQATK